MSAPTPRSDRVERPNTNMQAGGSLPFVFANDSRVLPEAHSPRPAARRPHITARRVALIASRLSPKDHQLLDAVSRLNVASHAQLRRLFYDDSESARRQARSDLARLTKLRIIGRLERRVGGVRAGSEGYVYALDIVGQRLTRPGRRRYRPPWTPRPEQVAHALAVSELYVALKASERPTATLASFQAEPASWRSYAGPGGGRARIKPDAYAVVDIGDYECRYFIEVDRSTESTSRLTEKARAYVRYWQSGREQSESGMFPLVVWVVPDARRHQQMTEALAALPAEHWHLFAVCTAEAAGALLTTPTDTEEVTP